VEALCEARRELCGHHAVTLAPEALSGVPFVFGDPSALPEIDVDQLAHLRAREPETVVLDVREPWEWRSGRVPGAVHIPLGQLVARVDELPRGHAVAVICAHGQRSLVAAQFLLRSGFDRVASVEGGTVAWELSGRDLEHDQPADGAAR
jgi:rhodanese-related sulfurtransferase